MTARVNPAGKRTTFGYDGSSRVTSIQQPGGGVLTYSYEAGNVTKFIDALSEVTTLEYDGSGNLTCQIDPLGNRTTCTWAGGRLSVVENPLGDLTTFAYATMTYEARQLECVQNPLGQCTTFLFNDDNQVEVVIDAEGNCVTQVWDANGEPHGRCRPIGKPDDVDVQQQGTSHGRQKPACRS